MDCYKYLFLFVKCTKCTWSAIFTICAMVFSVSFKINLILEHGRFITMVTIIYAVLSVCITLLALVEVSLTSPAKNLRHKTLFFLACPKCYLLTARNLLCINLKKRKKNFRVFLAFSRGAFRFCKYKGIHRQRLFAPIYERKIHSIALFIAAFLLLFLKTSTLTNIEAIWPTYEVMTLF